MRRENGVLIAAWCAALGLASGGAWAGDAANLQFPYTNDGSWTTALNHSDDSFLEVSLPFTFNFYGTDYTSAYINNNGNLSFGAPYAVFTSTGFPIANFPMVAPFWADVDTRNPDSGIVHYKFTDGNGDSTNDTMVVTWDNVGYFEGHNDKTNTFQVSISTGFNSTMGMGNNICFSYDDMMWTTGDQSSGVGGFGGTPATAGLNKGDGVTFAQVGRFDQPGNAYDGPNANNDGIDWLDYQTICFSVGTVQNLPPVALNMPAFEVVIDVSQGEVYDDNYQFIGPETGDAVVINSVADPDGALAGGLVMVNTNGLPATSSVFWQPGFEDLGVYHLNYMFTDSFGLSATSPLTIRVIPEPASLGVLAGLGALILRRRR